jgi:phosphatidylglycerol---prolipoprotein diacylglyceryl transferase
VDVLQGPRFSPFMHPLLFEPLHIEWYTALLLLGFFFGWQLMRRRSVAAGINPRHADNLVLLLLIAGLVGGRLAARLFYMPSVSFVDAFKIWKGGGLVFYGGFIAGVLTTICYGRVQKLPMAKFLDVCAPGVLVGLAFGRIGCFMAGCCFGDLCLPAGHALALEPTKAYQVHTVPALSPAQVGVQFPLKSDAYQQHMKLGLLEPGAAKSLPVHAVQLYEAAIAFALAFWLHRRKALFPGEISIRMLAGYSVARFVLEFFRGDNAPIYWGMTISQVTSLLLLAVAIVAAVWRARAGAAPYIPGPASVRT